MTLAERMGKLKARNIELKENKIPLKTMVKDLVGACSMPRADADSAKTAEIKELRSQRLELNAEIADGRKKIAAIAARARNQYSKGEIKKDFAAGKRVRAHKRMRGMLI